VDYGAEIDSGQISSWSKISDLRHNTFKGTKPFGKNPNNSPKLSLGMTFKNINLDYPTCVKKFEDPSHVVNWA
jgi:hypothetical protein